MDNYFNAKEFSNYHTLVTHPGCFHADDICVVAYIQLLRRWMNLPPLKVVRTFSINPNWIPENGYLISDVGGGRFDHHHEQKYRPNGVPYASFGLVALSYHFFLSEEEYKLFDKKFVQAIDLHDNTGCGNHFSYVISSFNKHWDSVDPNEELVQFFKAVEFASTAIDQMVNNIKSLAAAKQQADMYPIENRVLWLDKNIPVTEFYGESDVEFIGSPSPKGGYQLYSVKNKDGINKKLFPDEFRGLNMKGGESLENGMYFCHFKGYRAAFISKEAAQNFIKNFN